MLIIDNKSIPYFVSEIFYSNYLDFLNSEAKNIKDLIGIDLDFIENTYRRQKITNDIITNCTSYKAEPSESYIHNDSLYIFKPLHQLTILEGILAMNYAKEYSLPKYEAPKGLFAMRLYLLAALSRKVVNGQPEALPTNLGITLEFIDNRVNDLLNISLKNAIDFEAYYNAFELKLQQPFYYRAFKSLHPIDVKNIDQKAQERQQRYADFYGGFSIYEHLKTNNLIEDFNAPFFHSLFLFGATVNK